MRFAEYRTILHKKSNNTDIEQYCTKMTFSIKYVSADLVIFTEENFNGKLHFLCRAISEDNLVNIQRLEIKRLQYAKTGT